MINETLQQLAKKIQSNLNRQDCKFSLSDVRNAINKISTDYDNFTPEMTQEVMDI